MSDNLSKYLPWAVAYLIIGFSVCHTTKMRRLRPTFYQMTYKEFKALK